MAKQQSRGAGGMAGLTMLALLAASCAQPETAADQAPVNPVPGRYEISQSGKFLGMKGRDDDKKPGSMCVRAHEAATFPYTLAEAYSRIHPGCTTKRDPRQGDSITGVVSCPADPKMAADMNDFVYTGKISPEKIAISIKIKFDAELLEGRLSEAEIKQLKLGMKAMEHMRMTLDATRVGDCS